MAGVLLSLAGALIGAALWTQVLKVPLPFNFAAVAALLCGALAGLGMRLGKGKTPWTAVALAVLGALIGRYAAFVANTASLRLATGAHVPPAFWDGRTASFFLRTRFLSFENPWDPALSVLYLALAGYVAWRASRSNT